MMISRVLGEQEWYQTPSGYTTAMGPSRQILKQEAWVRWMPPCSLKPRILRRLLRYSQAASEALISQHFEFVGFTHKKIWRLVLSKPSA